MTIAQVHLTIARDAGRCWECECRYRSGEVIVLNGPLAYHSDCYRTRGAVAVTPYEEQQPIELDRLLAVIQAEELLSSGPAAEASS
ncbi:MAG: hypothetical protein JO247_15655 [Chloroflexi bacterium]|nr:hypothetical protein [Chloroflexota bacterium]